jgi:N utilization substance protein A
MTPEQLEEVPGIGPKTVEKISIAVNNYFSSLDAAAEGLPDAGEEVGQDVPAEEEARDLAETEAAEEESAESPEDAEAAERDDDSEEGGADDVETVAESDVTPGEEGGQSGSDEGLSDVPEDSPESVEELADEGQAFEAEVIDGVENAPSPEHGERVIHERLETPNENVPDEEKSGEQK